MTRELVFIHGRAQEHKDSIALKAEWLKAFANGLAKAGLAMPIDEVAVRFPYYGQTLYDLVEGGDDADAAKVVVRGTADDAAQRAFFQAVFDEIQERHGIDRDKLQAAAGREVVEKGPLNWEWLQGVLQAVDDYVPGASSASIALATYDVYQYLNNPVVHKTINDGVRAAITNDRETVVVSHSLGTVVAYNLLRKDPQAGRWQIPLFVTLGSPLGIKAIRDHVKPIGHPACAKKWFNALDERDVVALYPLDASRFDVDPPIENKRNVDNPTPNRHGISGYLGDPEVAAKIHAALLA
jgi:pimeloyl-ACP methyl ester carboxylesterase